MSSYNWEKIFSRFSNKELVRIVNDQLREPDEKVNGAIIELEKRGFSVDKMKEINEAINKEIELGMVYAGVIDRAFANFLDFIIFIPIIYLMYILDNLYVYNIYLSNLLYILIVIVYYVYIVKKYSGTPGKLILGIKIKKINNKNIEWKEAFLRFLVTFVFILIQKILLVISFSKADLSFYENLSWLQKTTYLQNIFPSLFLLFIWLQNIWSLSELIVLLTNDKKRSLHDYIAGTVVVKEKYFKKYIEVETDNNDPESISAEVSPNQPI